MEKKRIVTIGGGTGSFTLLSGVKNYQYDITAVVTMADDGGSTGKLRDELGVLPPGDVRQCLVALSDSSVNLRELMNYRFEEGELEGHNFGNLFLSALEKINGGFSNGVEQAIKILNVRGRVVPVSEGDMRLKIRLNDGRVISGEKELDDNPDVRKVGVHDICLAKRVCVNQKAANAIGEAHYIIIGPGDHYGSIIPNLLVGGLKKAIKKSAAKVIFVSPLTNKKGLTDDYAVSDYVRDIENLIGTERVNFIVYNTKEPDSHLRLRYEKQEGKNSLVKCDEKNLKECRIVYGDLLHDEHLSVAKNDKISHTRAFIRHDSEKLARAIALITEHEEYRNFTIT